MTIQEDRATRILKDVGRFGPAEAAGIHRLKLPEFVTAITGIVTTFCNIHHNGDIVLRTNQDGGIYHDSGLAVEPFPTFWHRYLTDSREIYENSERKYEKDHRKIIDEIPRSNAKNARIKKELTDRLEKTLELNRQIAHGEAPFQRSALTGGDVYNNYRVDAALVGQWIEDRNVIEVYTAGNHGVSGKGIRPREYFIYTFDKEKGGLLKRGDLPLTMPGKLSWIQTLLYISTLSFSSMIIDGISIPFKKALEHKVFEKVQENWKRRFEKISSTPE